MTCRLGGAKPSSEPMLEYCYLDPWEQTSVKSLSKFINIDLRKCIWKYHLENGGHFVSASMLSPGQSWNSKFWRPSIRTDGTTLYSESGPEISISQSHQFLPTSSTKSNIILLPLCLCRWREQPVVWHRILRRRSPSNRTYCWLSTWGPSDECHTETQDPSQIIHWSLGDAVAILNRYFSN